MRGHEKLAAGVMLLAMLGGCVTDGKNTQIGAIGGGLLATGACLALGGNAKTCAAAAVIGAVAGGMIGNQIDQRDQEVRTRELNKALNDEIVWNTPVSVAAAQPASGAQPAAPVLKETISWTYPETQNRSEIVPLRAYAEPSSGRECREFDETYIRNGKEIRARQRACKQMDGMWKIEDI